MYGRLDSRHIPDVDNDVSHTQSQRGVDREFRPEYSRPGSIASREPPATSTRDYADAATERGTGASFYRKEELLEDVREHVGDFAEWRMDYSRQLAKYAVRPLCCVAPRTAALPPVLCVWRLAQLSCT